MLRIAGVDVFTRDCVSTSEKQKNRNKRYFFPFHWRLKIKNKEPNEDRTQRTLASVTASVIAQRRIWVVGSGKILLARVKGDGFVFVGKLLSIASQSSSLQ